MIKTRVRRFINRLLLSPPLTRLYDQADSKLSLGDRGEREAERFLLRLGYVIVARSFETELGEVDLIAVDGETVVFVEVKTRRNTDKGLPEEAVDETKQSKIALLATGYLRRYQLEDHTIRFDIISILWEQNERPFIKHFKSAFDAPRHID